MEYKQTIITVIAAIGVQCDSENGFEDDFNLHWSPLTK